MRSSKYSMRVVALAVAAVPIVCAQNTSAARDEASIAQALEVAMTPGEAHERLDFLVGTFDVRIRTWLDPSQPPAEFTGTSVANWVLEGHYVQQMLAAFVMGEPWSGIGYAGFDNVTKKYVATYMDSDSTGMLWFEGTMDPEGESLTLRGTTHDDITGEPRPVEMRLSIGASGDHVTTLWLGDEDGTLSKVLELQYVRNES